MDPSCIWVDVRVLSRRLILWSVRFGSRQADASALTLWFSSHLCVVVGQLGVKAGLEEARVAVSLHQTEDLILGQLEGGGVDTQPQALIGHFPDRRIHIDLNAEHG